MSKKVLVVEDYENVAHMVARILEHCGYDAKHALDGKTTLELVQEWKPDVVLLNIGLPDMDGYEVVRKLRQELAYDGKIYILSGFTPDDEKIAQNKIDAYIIKPIDIPRLRQLIDG